MLLYKLIMLLERIIMGNKWDRTVRNTVRVRPLKRAMLIIRLILLTGVTSATIRCRALSGFMIVRMGLLHRVERMLRNRDRTLISIEKDL